MPYKINNLPAHIINGLEISTSNKLKNVFSIDPYSGEELWSCSNATEEQLNNAIKSSHEGYKIWSRISLEERILVLKKFTDIVSLNKDFLINLISQEVGKPIWESTAEVNSLISKLDVSIDAYNERCAVTIRDIKGKKSVTKFKPHGVLAVIGPFNFPLTMPNGHIMPSLIAGNSVIFKPSEFAPLSGIAISKMWQEAGLPKGVLNCINGDSTVGKSLADSEDINGILFVGSHKAGISILSSQPKNPNRIIALEMGGNSPLILEDFDKTKTKEVLSILIQSSFITSGQRCSSARRLLVNIKHKNILADLKKALEKIDIGSYDSDNPIFYGPIIRQEAAKFVLKQFEELKILGGKVILEPKIFGPNKTLMTPGVIDVTDCSQDKDEEIFGPIVKVYFYEKLDDAIDLANNTKFGLAAGIITESQEIFNEFYLKINAGIINWNQSLTGATKFAPFGGIKESGNFNPAGYLSSDYCSYATASYEVPPEKMSVSNSPGINLIIE